jgi:hypothetical protein
VRGGKLVDVTSQFCSKLFRPGSEDYGVWTRVLTPGNINKLRSTSEIRGNQETCNCAALEGAAVRILWSV